MRRVLAALTIVSLAVLTPVQAQASPEEDDLAQAKELHLEGLGQFDTADYAGAIESWTKAYTLIADVPENAKVKASVIFNLASAHEEAFEIDRDFAHLRQARVLFERYLEQLGALYGEDQATIDAERAKADERLVVLDQLIAEADAEEEAGESTSGTSQSADSGPNKSKPLIISGAVLTGLGVAGLGVMGAGMGIGSAANEIGDDVRDDAGARGDQFARGRAGNAMAWGGGIGGGVLVVVGVALLAVGAKAKKREVAVAPVWGEGLAGLGISGRF